MKITNLKDKFLTGALFLAILAIFLIFKFPCPFTKFLGIPCLGCGMTRAYIHLLHLDFQNAFRMHPMFWSVPIGIIYYIFDWKLFKVKWLDRAILGLIVAGFVVNWIIKLF